MQKLKDLKALVSGTPLVEVKYKYNDNINFIYAKCEWFSLTGSIKDKVALQIFLDAYSQKQLKKGDRIVEVSSGNMGLAISAIGNLLGNPVKIIMPRSMSEERKKLIRLYGATLVEADDFRHAFTLQENFIKQGYFSTGQFSNLSNVKVHKEITAKEIFDKIKNKKVKAFVSGVGTGGTLVGVGSVLKEKLNLKVFAIEPFNARLLSGQKPFLHHKIQGVSDEIVPDLYDKNIVDKIIPIKDEDAIAMSQKLAKVLSLGVGISSGANFIGAVLSQRTCVTVFADDNKKYLSTDLSSPVSTPLVDAIDLLDVRVL